MIYFDNAATGGFKPRAVTDAAKTVLQYLSANPGRSGHRLAIAGAQTVYACRQALAKTFSAEPDRVIFTKNCTEALNVAIFGCIREGGHVITTVFEHNSVLRPLFSLKEKGRITLDIIAPNKNEPIGALIEKAIRPETFLIVTTALSNVTGEVLPISKIGAIAKKKNIIYIVDGAQGGGHIPIDVKKDNISALALAGHKGLYGIMGSSALILSSDLELSPLLFGGTGSESFNPSQPDCYPERLEAGTLNLPAIASLNEGIRYVNANLFNFGKQLLFSTALLIEQLKGIKAITCYSLPNEGGIVSFALKGVPSTELADTFSREYDIAVRGGFHCAPLMHKYLGTDEDGLLRVSLAVQNTSTEIYYFIKALKELAVRY